MQYKNEKNTTYRKVKKWPGSHFFLGFFARAITILRELQRKDFAFHKTNYIIRGEKMQ